jgi:hypothetical protein
MQIQFKAGSPTPDNVEFRWNAWTGSVRVVINGQTIYRSLSLSDRGGPTGLSVDDGGVEGFEVDRFTSGWKFQAGPDKDLVTITKQRPRWLGMLLPHRFRVTVSGGTVLERSGR